MTTRMCVAVAVALTCVWARAGLVINEVCYDNSTVADESGDTSSDWIELYNSGPTNMNLRGYAVGDANPYAESSSVVLTNYTLPVGGYYVVFTSGELSKTTAWVRASDIAVIPTNSTWRYYSSSSAPVAIWKTNTFNDASWATGMSPLGYNDTKLNLDCATVLDYGGNPSSRYPTAYFRKAFALYKPSVVTGLVMNARANDGMVVYLNGNEVLRYNLPGGTVTNSTLATLSLPSTQWTSVRLATNSLIQGTNIVAVEVHQASVSSPDLIMDMSLTALVNEQVPVIHGKFGLSKDFVGNPDNVHLFDATTSHTRIQKFLPPSGAILPGQDQTYGAYPDGSTSAFKVYSKPTPGAANSLALSEMLTAQKPAFSKAPGAYASNQSVTLSTATAGYKILYSIDSSDPRASSLYVYSGSAVTVSNLPPATSGLAWLRTTPVEITNSVPTAAWLPPSGSVTKALVLRAVAVSADGNYCSPETSGTYFIGPSFTNRVLPVVSLIASANDLFGFVPGIYVPGKLYADSSEGYGSNKWGKPHANYHQDSDTEGWERPLHLELFETSQTTASVSQVMGTTMYGGGTRSLPQKTLYLLARLTEYGTEYVTYKLFPNEAATTYKRFLLRNSGNDWYGPDNAGVATMMKDAALTEIVKGLNQSVMAYRPTVAYINGEYWGLHNLRESYDKHYLATRYGLDSENVDILMHEDDPQDSGKIVITRIDGNKTADEDYLAMIDWVDANGLSSTANYQYIQTQIDVTNYTDYIISESFFANTDWPANNCDFWRAHTNQVATCGKYGDTRWRWMLYDLDMAGENGSSYNMFTYLSGSSMTGKREPGFLINALWQNSDYRTFFATRYANLLNTTLRPERMAGIIGQDANAIAPEIETHYRRWGRTYTQSQWRQAVTNALVQFTAARQTVSWTHLNSFFTLGGVGALTVRNSQTNGVGGRFTVNGVVIDTTTDGVTNRAAWTGSFFRSMAVPVQAVPDAGYVFDGWVGTTVTNATRSLIVEASPKKAVARFRLAAAPAYAPTGYEQWQMANYTEQEILSGVTAESAAPSGCAGMSNFELYAFGMRRTDGLTDAQRQARVSLSLNNRTNRLWVGYTRLNSGFTDVRYTLKITPKLSAPVVWSNAVTGVDLDAVALTNALDASTWFYEVRLPASSPVRDARFFKLEASQP